MFFIRKCDKIGCSSSSPIWRVNSGCGHSFHIECILPTVSVCPICLETINNKVASLGKAANLATFQTTGSSGDEIEDTDDEESVDGDSEHGTCDNDSMTKSGHDNQEFAPNIVSNIINEIAMWNHARAPSQP